MKAEEREDAEAVGAGVPLSRPLHPRKHRQWLQGVSRRPRRDRVGCKGELEGGGPRSPHTRGDPSQVQSRRVRVCGEGGVLSPEGLGLRLGVSGQWGRETWGGVGGDP